MADDSEQISSLGQQFKEWLLKENDNAKALIEFWDEVSKHPVPMNAKELIEEVWHDATSPLFADFIQYDDADKKADRTRLVRLDIAIEALITQNNVFINTQIKSRFDILKGIIKELLDGVIDQLTSLGSIIAVFIGWKKAIELFQNFAKKLFEVNGIRNALKDSAAIAFNAKSAAAACRRGALPQRKGRRRYRKESVRA